MLSPAPPRPPNTRFLPSSLQKEYVCHFFETPDNQAQFGSFIGGDFSAGSVDANIRIKKKFRTGHVID
jgi:hypothetical protein